MSLEAFSPFDQIYLAFDIHDVLAETSTNSQSASLFQSSGMILRLPMGEYCRPMRHYTYPFVKELFQLLAMTVGVHLAIFTSSKKFIAKAFAEQLFLNTFEEKDRAEITARISVLAKEQLRDRKTYHKEQYNPHSVFGTQKKDLDDVFTHPEIHKGQRLLIDDSSSFAAPHQINNLLCVWGYNWTDKFCHYQQYGYPLFYCTSQEVAQNKIKKGVSFALLEKTDRSIVIIYHDREGQKELELNEKDSLKIYKWYQTYTSEYKTSYWIKHQYNDSQKRITEELNKLNLSTPSDDEVVIAGEGASLELNNIVIRLSDIDPFIRIPSGIISLKDKKYSQLIKYAKEYWDDRLINGSFGKTTFDTQLYDLVWNKIKDPIWKEKLIEEANHILLVTGAIFSAWEESKTSQTPISDILFKWQCKETPRGIEFEPCILKNRTDLYQKGLELLRTVKPDLEPITIKTFEAAQEMYPELPDDGAYEHKDGCVIS